MKAVKLSAYPRALVGRSGAKKVRAQGRVPAVIYGRGRPAQNIEIALKEWVELQKQAATENLLVELSLHGDDKPVRLTFVREAQHHPLTGRLLHVDFQEVDPNEKVTVTVPIETVGEAVGVKSGGVLEHILHRVRIRALPKDIPEVIEVDVTNLGLGKVLHLGDIVPPPGVEILGDKTLPVAAVVVPRAEEETVAPAAAPAPSEVEMIKEKKPEAGEASEQAEAARDKTAEKAKTPEKDKAQEKTKQEKK